MESGLGFGEWIGGSEAGARVLWLSRRGWGLHLPRDSGDGEEGFGGS